MNIRKALLAALTLMGLVMSQSANAVLVKEGKASLDATKHCTKLAPGYWKAACFLLMADPPVPGVTSIAWSGTFDPEKFEIWPDPLYFGDFSERGVYIRTAPGLPGGLRPLNSDPGIIEEDHYNPRAGAVTNFVVDNVNGSFSLTMDLSANPVPLDAPAQNFFGVYVRAKAGPVVGVEYFSDPEFSVAAEGQMNFSDVQCTSVGGAIGCGSDSPASSITVTSVPEPAAWAMLLVGLGVVGSAERRSRGNRELRTAV